MKIVRVTLAALALTAAAATAGFHKSSIKPVGNPQRWAAPEDADGAVLQQGGGTATVSYDITAAGRVTNCQVVKMTGSPRIGVFICRLMVQRGRYVPGIAGTGTYTMGWNAPS